MVNEFLKQYNPMLCEQTLWLCKIRSTSIIYFETLNELKFLVKIIIKHNVNNINKATNYEWQNSIAMKK